MYCSKTVSSNVENFSFACLGSVLQIVFSTKEDDITLKSINIKDDNATLSGTFTVDTDGKANITATDKAGITLDLGDGVAVGLAAKYFNIAIPAGNYQALTLTFTGTDGSKCVMTDGKVNIAHNIVGRLTLTGKEFERPNEGKAYAEEPKRDVKWIQLWKDGPKFAEHNIGANFAYEYGDYFRWGKPDRLAYIDWKNWLDHHEGNLTEKEDMATVLWGNNWRMPTQEDFQALADNCDIEMTDDYKNSKTMGIIFTGRDDYQYNSIFLPAAGKGTVIWDNGVLRTPLEITAGAKATEAYYWSSTPSSTDEACILFYHMVKREPKEYSFLSDGDTYDELIPVRPVLKEE